MSNRRRVRVFRHQVSEEVSGCDNAKVERRQMLHTNDALVHQSQPSWTDFGGLVLVEKRSGSGKKIKKNGQLCDYFL